MTLQQLHFQTSLTSFPTLILTPLAWAPLIQLTTVQITLICSIQQELINLQKESTNSVHFSLPTHSRIRSSISTQTLLTRQASLCLTRNFPNPNFTHSISMVPSWLCNQTLTLQPSSDCQNFCISNAGWSGIIPYAS
jgi:hypothetical protein